MPRGLKGHAESPNLRSGKRRRGHRPEPPGQQARAKCELGPQPPWPVRRSFHLSGLISQLAAWQRRRTAMLSNHQFQVQFLSAAVLLVVLAQTASGTGLTHETAMLAQGRGFIAATSVGNKALFAGGRTTQSKSFSDVVDIYDADTGSWSTAWLLEARSFMAATCVGDKAFFAGGGNGSDTCTDVVDIFDATSGTWTTDSLSQGGNRRAKWAHLGTQFGPTRVTV